MTQRVAAARAGIAERTARRYERVGALPSQLKRPHDWKTRIDPFEHDWPWVVSELERDPALQGSTLFALLCERHPGRYRPTQVRYLTAPYSAVARLTWAWSRGDVCSGACSW